MFTLFAFRVMNKTDVHRYIYALMIKPKTDSERNPEF